MGPDIMAIYVLSIHNRPHYVHITLWPYMSYLYIIGNMDIIGPIMYTYIHYACITHIYNGHYLCITHIYIIHM